MNEKELLIGTARRDITPDHSVQLAGFASRKVAVYEIVKEKIWLRALVFSCGEQKVLFLNGDLIWWDPEFIQRARRKVSKVMNLQEEGIFFTATHNHCGPATGNSFVPEMGGAFREYLDFLEGQVLDASVEALGNLTPVICRRREGRCDLNVYRRVKSSKGIEMRPNYQVPADRTLTMLSFERLDGSLKAFGIHYACHANLCGENVIQPDYPGVAIRLLEEERPGCLGFFWQGCTADLRPNSVLGREFRRCTYDETCVFARQFADLCEELLHTPGSRIIPDLEYSRRIVELPVILPSPENCAEAMLKSEDALQRSWARCVLEKKEMKNVQMAELCRVQLGKGLIFYGISAEVAQEYQKFVRQLEPGAFCTGYTNGMVGYLCTAEQIAEGGYEPQESALYFAVNGTYSEQLETILKEELCSLRMKKQTEMKDMEEEKEMGETPGRV